MLKMQFTNLKHTSFSMLKMKNYYIIHLTVPDYL